ncbi:MAG: phosphotransferase family protein [Gammaproteobacteria bacterium]|jgi:aminoglycoside phosphotransferase (APT) family kinase protein|nr:phosphotransferase family protein [Gammaproteobacteria bacterium]
MTKTEKKSNSTNFTIEIASQHRFDTNKLCKWMTENVAGFSPPIEISQFENGMSNPSFLISGRSDKNFVLRKKPPGKLLPSAHAVDREHAIMDALKHSDVPVPKMYAFCSDKDVIGTEFFVMEHIMGRVFDDVSLPGLSKEERSAIYKSMGITLAKLHSVNFKCVGLESYGRVGGYLSRQVKRWSDQYRASQTEKVDSMEQLMAWLPTAIPSNEQTTIAHGDFRLGNLIIHENKPEVVAVLDWELSTLGDPLSDLAYNCLAYHWPQQAFNAHRVLGENAEGVPTELEYLKLYCNQTGREAINDWTFYLVLSMFRAAAIIQGVYFRGTQGNAPTKKALLRRDLARQLADKAWSMVKHERLNRS